MGSIVSGIFGGGDAGGAAEEAAAVQQQASQQAIEEQRRQFGITQQQLAPFQQAALPALSQFQALLGLGGGVPGVGGVGLTEQQIRQELIQSGQFGAAPTGRAAPAGGRRTIGGFDRLAGLSNQQISQMAAAGDPEAQVRLDLMTRFPGREFGAPREEGLVRGAGGLDRAALEAEVQRRFAAQRAGPQTALEAQQAAMASLIESPGQRFIRGRAEQGLTRQAAALGGLGGGRVRTALTQQAAGFAQQDLQNRFARLQALIGGGQQAATGLGQFGAAQAGQIGQLLQAGGQARAGGILGAQQAEAQQAQGLAGLIGAGLSFFPTSDERLKENIQELNLKDCFEAVVEMPLKSWCYLEKAGLDTEIHLGPMAQEAPDMIRAGEINGFEALSLHDELMMIAGAIQYMKNEGMLKCH